MPSNNACRHCPPNSSPENEEILDTRKMRLLSKMSDRTLLRRRNDGTLPYFRRGGKIYYVKSKVLRALEKHESNQHR